MSSISTEEADRILRSLIYDYLVQCDLQQSANALQVELKSMIGEEEDPAIMLNKLPSGMMTLCQAQKDIDTTQPQENQQQGRNSNLGMVGMNFDSADNNKQQTSSPTGSKSFLVQWFGLFWDMYAANAKEYESLAGPQARHTTTVVTGQGDAVDQKEFGGISGVGPGAAGMGMSAMGGGGATGGIANLMAASAGLMGAQGMGASAPWNANISGQDNKKMEAQSTAYSDAARKNMQGGQMQGISGKPGATPPLSGMPGISVQGAGKDQGGQGGGYGGLDDALRETNAERSHSSMYSDRKRSNAATMPASNKAARLGNTPEMSDNPHNTASSAANAMAAAGLGGGNTGLGGAPGGLAGAAMASHMKGDLAHQTGRPPSRGNPQTRGGGVMGAGMAGRVGGMGGQMGSNAPVDLANSNVGDLNADYMNYLQQGGRGGQQQPMNANTLGAQWLNAAGGAKDALGGGRPGGLGAADYGGMNPDGGDNINWEQELRRGTSPNAASPGGMGMMNPGPAGKGMKGASVAGGTAATRGRGANVGANRDAGGGRGGAAGMQQGFRGGMRGGMQAGAGGRRGGGMVGGQGAGLGVDLDLQYGSGNPNDDYAYMQQGAGDPNAFGMNLSGGMGMNMDLYNTGQMNQPDQNELAFNAQVSLEEQQLLDIFSGPSDMANKRTGGMPLSLDPEASLANIDQAISGNLGGASNYGSRGGISDFQMMLGNQAPDDLNQLLNGLRSGTGNKAPSNMKPNAPGGMGQQQGGSRPGGPGGGNSHQYTGAGGYQHYGNMQR